MAAVAVVVEAAAVAAVGMENTITQDATTLTVEYRQGQNPVKLVYKLDGSESKNKVQGRGGSDRTGLEGDVGRRQAQDHDDNAERRCRSRALARRRQPGHRFDHPRP